ncbi:MAG TPA: Rieske 2Fe-2S domain-containing protein [Vicinamibacterales bacterium]|nr:Rieske 2Fe-2S domain-containing protein [Vicinamibacterales bacterium]
MNDPRKPTRASIDARVNSPAREGLTGTAPASVYTPAADREQITTPPDFSPIDVQPAWRRDFPVDWPEDRYVERREFTKFMVLTSFALFAGQMWIAAKSWWQGRQGAAPGMRIGSLDDIPVGGTLVFRYPEADDVCVLVRLDERQLVAYSQECTHLSCPVIPRPERGVLHCPCHDGVFDLRSGRAIAGPPSRPLPRILLDVRRRDIYATGVEPGAA